MYGYILKRILLAAVTLLVILAISYLLLRLAPGDPASSNLLSQNAEAGTVNAEKGRLGGNSALRKELHLDRPIPIGFYYWMKKIVTEGDFGNSASVDPGRPVLLLLRDRLPVTLSLNFLAILITYFVAIPLGIYSAVNLDRLSDKVITFSLFLLYSLPVIWVGLLLQTLFCEGGKIPIFPLKGLQVPDSADMSTWQWMNAAAMHYVLPVFCLAYAGLAGLSRYARSTMSEVLQQEYIRTARAKGASEYQVVMHHAFRNGVITLITLFAGLLPSLVAGSVIVEYVFNIPGMGTLSLAALSSRDYPLQMALFTFAGILTLSGIFLADLLYLWADPRIKLR